jgi:hypothetical protein
MTVDPNVSIGRGKGARMKLEFDAEALLAED